MTPSGGATSQVAVAALPADRDVLLERILPERQKLYRLVRRVLDELDEAAPWEQLYYPPDDADAFLGMVAALLGVVDQVPVRTRELVELLSVAAPDDETRLTLEEAEFYFAGIHSMCGHDLSRLRSLLEPLASPGAPAPTLGDRTFLCEVAADLKGKYASALMGATASIVGEGHWSGVEVEPVLFPEKVEEFRRNGDLVRALRRSIEAIDELRVQVPFAELLARWREGARVDPYALADLATFRGILAQLLKRGLRRALYSGDYHQIQRREAALAGRIAELEALHHRTWAEPWVEPARAPGAPERHQQLVRLTLEIAAILDAELLEELVGSRAFKDLRTAAAATKRAKLDAELESLVPLLSGEDLRTFLSMLIGSVLKRASLSAAARTSPAAERPRPGGETEEDLLPSIDLVEPAAAERPAKAPARAPEPRQPAPKRVADARAAAASSRAPVKEAIEPAGTIELAAVPTPVRPPVTLPAATEGRRETLQRLHESLLQLQSGENPNWASYRMLQRLLERHARIPPAIVQGAHPFVYEVLNGLVPQLEAAAAFDAVPKQARQRLVECCLALTDDQLSPEHMIDEVPAQLARLQRLLEALTAATAAQLRAPG